MTRIRTDEFFWSTEIVYGQSRDENVVELCLDPGRSQPDINPNVLDLDEWPLTVRARGPHAQRTRRSPLSDRDRRMERQQSLWIIGFQGLAGIPAAKFRGHGSLGEDFRVGCQVPGRDCVRSRASPSSSLFPPPRLFPPVRLVAHVYRRVFGK